MKICRFVHNNKVKSGYLAGDLIYPVDTGFFNLPKTIDLSTIDSLSINEVKPVLPTTPSKIVCVGRNYIKHAAEMGNEIPQNPLLFLKAPSSLILDGEDILIPEQSDQVEHEGELALVVGKICRNLKDDDDFYEYIRGFACLNDVTARDIQRREIQFTRAKSFDTFCPFSSFLETNVDILNLRITATINGEIKQQGKTSEMVFPVPFLVKYISRQMTLFPGDIIATGTPSGVSKLNDGDTCEIQIEGVGSIRNSVKTQLSDNK